MAARTHGMSETKIYATWCRMKGRCYSKTNRKYYRYGARGITVCDEWLGENGFMNFYNWSMENGYSEELSIDRIDNDKGYSPDNCRWADNFQQANNTSKTHKITYNGETHSIAEWSRILGISRCVIKDRITKLHWSDDLALSTPVLRREQWSNKKGGNNGNFRGCF